jgi:hypothetical protein
MTIKEAMQYERRPHEQANFSTIAEEDKSFISNANLKIPRDVSASSLPAGAIYCGRTTWDYQWYGNPQRSIEHAVALTGPWWGKRFIHVIWAMSEVHDPADPNRNVHYNCFDWSIPGWTVSTHESGGMPLIEVGECGGPSHIDVNLYGQAVIFHHSVAVDYGYTRIARVHIPGHGIYVADNLINLSGQHNVYACGTAGIREDEPPTYVYHVGSHDSNPEIGETAVQSYWRFLELTQIWEGPVPMGQSMLPSHVLAADGERVIFAWSQARDYSAGHHYDNDLAYWESTNAGADWITNGGYTQSDWEAGAGYNVTDYVDADPHRVFIDISIMFDFNARLHAGFTTPAYNAIDSTVSVGPTVMYHWDEGTPGSNENAAISGGTAGGFAGGQDAFHHVAASAMWGINNPVDANAGLSGAWNRYISKMTLGIGDGSTACDAVNNNSNRGHLYLCYTLFGGEKPADKADASSHGYQNGNIYISISPDNGVHWDKGRCLTTEEGNLCGTPTRSPGCEGEYGDLCRSEHWGSIARLVNDTLHAFYVCDYNAGAAPLGEGPFTLNNVVYHPVIGDGTINGNLCPCICGDFCNLDGVAGYTPVDIIYIVNFVYKQLDARQSLSNCASDNGDWDCSGYVTPVDVTYYVQYVYRSSGVGPCDPCNCDPYPTGCPGFP